MSGKNLTFKLVMDADTKGFDAGTKASKDNWESFISLLKKEADGLKAASVETGKEVSKIVPDDLQKKADQAKGKLGEVAQAANALETQASQASGKIDGLGSELQDTANKANKAGFEIGGAIPGDAVQLAEMLGNKFFSAAKEIESLGDKSTISAGELRAMSSAGEQGLNELNLALKAAQAELVRLQSTDGTLQDIEIAKQRVLSIQDAINEASSAFNYYQGVAINAMKGVDGATQSAINQVQRFSAVDLTGVVGEAQTATRAIESMGDGASLSTKEIERIGSIGTNSINTLERELLTARNAFSALEKSSEAVTLNEIKAAGDKVKGLEQAVDLTKSAFSEFNVKATTAMQGVSTSTDKASGSAKQAGHAIYDALGIKPPSVINDAIADLTRKLENFKANSKLPAEEVERVTKITEQQIEKLKSELNGVEPAAQKANSGVSTLSKGMDGAKFAVTALVGALATIGVGLGLRELAQAADSYTNLSARINIATSDGGNFQQAMAGVHQVALMTNSSLDATAGLFTKVNDTGKQMGMTQQQSLDLVKTINMAIQTGGGSAAAADAAITQFTQALQSGVLRGDEFNSIMEQAPGISKALAQSLGVTTGELRKMAENGELSAEKVIKALQGQSAAIEADYAKFPTTIGNALQRIQTQWQILIGTMDQSNGASATVAQWLVTISDNMGMVETLLDDIGEGFIWAGGQLKKIDPATIEALKAALVSVYDVVKSVGSALATSFEAAGDLINTALSQVFSFSSGVDAASDKTNGFTKVLQVINVALGYLADGFNAIGIGINLFVGALYSAGSAWEGLKSNFTWGAVRDEAIANMTAMQNKAEEYYQKAEDGALNFESQGKKAWEKIGKTQEQKNAESLQGSKDTLDKLAKQEQEHTASYKAIADERLKLEQQLYEARKTGSQTSIDMALKGLADLDAKEKAYQAESQKITDAKVEAAQVVASAMVKSADAAGFAELKTLNAKLAAQGLMAEFDSTGKVVVKAMQDAAIATEHQSNTTDKARKAATALGIDLDVSLNRVSAKFKESEGQLNNFTAGLDELGITGEEAGSVTYEAWQKWAEQAKSQAEIDMAKAKLIEFEEQGVFSAKQVQMGMEYLDQVNGKLPKNISEVEKAYRLLGIASREEASKIADAQMKAFDVLKKSGTATAEQLKQALINMSDKIYASGDAAKISWYEGQLAANNLEASIDSTGKASVKAMDELTSANHRVRDSAHGIGDGFRNAGEIAREEAKSSSEAWAETLNAAREADKVSAGAKKTVNRGYYTENEIRDKVLSSGEYTFDQAEEIAKRWLSEYLSKGNGGNRDEFINKYGLTNATYIDEQLQRMKYGSSKGKSISSVPVNLNDYAPSIPSAPSVRDLDPTPKTTIRIEAGNGQYVDAQVNADQVNPLTQILKQLGTLKGST